MAVTHDESAGITRLYVDGVEDALLTGWSGSNAEDATLYVGNSAGGTAGFVGIIDEVRVTQRVLTAGEVLVHSRQVYLTGERGAQGPTGAVGQVGPQGRTGLIGDTLAGHIQLVTGGWVRAGGATAGVLFGETGGAYGIWGRGSNVTQIEISAADGRLRAGRGAAVLDEEGVNIYSATGPYDAAHSLSFKQAVTGVDVRAGYLGGKVQGPRSYLLLRSVGATGQDASLMLEAEGGLQNTRQTHAGVDLMATCYTGAQPSYAAVSLRANPDNRNSIYCEAPDGYFGIYGIGLLVGDCGETVDVPPGEIWADVGFSSDAGVTVVKAGQNAAVAVKLTQDWTTGPRVLADCLAAGLGMPAGYYAVFDAFSASPLWFGKMSISESVAASLGDIYLGGSEPTAGMVLWLTMREVYEL